VTPTAPDLPSAYALFASVLERLSQPLRTLLSGQLAQFERLIGRFDEEQLHIQGEFEGLGSLTTHGDLSQIVQSELLLRTEVPLEFLRRLAESETLYLERQYTDPGAKPVYRLILSVGPGLLGHGRILALAAIFFMARVAAQKGGVFHWCYLPNTNGPIWFDEISVNTVKRFLRAASYREMTPEEAVDAHDVWNGLNATGKGRAKPHHVDWVFGARAARSAPRTNQAVSSAARALSFTLNPPVIDMPRTAEIFVRRKGSDRQVATLTFPADAVCLSALSNPFAPIKPAQVSGGLPATIRSKMEGWEPLYFTSPITNAKIVRVQTGILILYGNPKLGFFRKYFVPVPAHAKIAGIRLNANTLALLVQLDMPGVERLAFVSATLFEDSRPPELKRARYKDVPTSHLFRNQNPYALPVIGGVGDQNIFYATNRKAFGFGLEANGDVKFDAHIAMAPIIYSNGIHRIVKAESDRVPIIRVLRSSNDTMAEFSEGETGFSKDRLYGLIYSSSRGSLAFSASPNVWTIAAPRTHQFRRGGPVLVEGDSTQFETAIYENPLVARSNEGVVTATLWSDPRQGGNGTIQTIHFKNDQVRARKNTVDLGADAADIRTVQLTDDGIWAVSVDADEAPSQLLHYVRKSKGGRPNRFSFDLNALQKEATVIDMIGMANG
jgi:hypothetical protein